MQKLKYFSYGGIFTAIILLVFQSFNSAPIGQREAAHCNDDARYENAGDEQDGGGRSISLTDANYYISTFQNLVPAMNGRRGFFLSKKAVDALFDSDESANGIICCPGVSGSGEITMVVAATKAVNTRISDNSTGIYMAESFCPNICGVFAK